MPLCVFCHRQLILGIETLGSSVMIKGITPLHHSPTL